MSKDNVATVAGTPGAEKLDAELIAKLPAGALKRVLLRLRNEDHLVVYADHDSHVMFGSHESHGSHGQHTSTTGP
jgi:hypothetical protein